MWSSLPTQPGALGLIIFAGLVLSGALIYSLGTYTWSLVVGRGEDHRPLRRALVGLALETVLAVGVFLSALPDLMQRRWRRRDGEGTLAILLPGYTETQFVFRYLYRHLDAARVPYETWRFRPLLGDPRRLARDLGEHIDVLCRERGIDQVDIVGHSMGGLVGRYLLHVLEHPRVRRVVTIASPHHGTLAAHLGLGDAARQMVPTSPLMDELRAAHREDPRLRNIYTAHDNIVIPPSSSALGEEDRVLRAGWGHVSVTFSPEVARQTIQFLRPEPDPS